MTQHEATIYAALIATAGALLGGIIGSLGTYFIQKNTIENETKEHAKRELITEEIKALQQFSMLIDFLEATDGHINEDFKFFNQLWERIHGCSRSVGYMPDELRNDARDMIKKIYQGVTDGNVQLEGEDLLSLRKTILEKIDSLKCSEK